MPLVAAGRRWSPLLPLAHFPPGRHEAEGEEAAAGGRVAAGSSPLSPQRRTLVPLPGPDVRELAWRAGWMDPPAAGESQWKCRCAGGGATRKPQALKPRLRSQGSARFRTASSGGPALSAPWTATPRFRAAFSAFSRPCDVKPLCTLRQEK